MKKNVHIISLFEFFLDTVKTQRTKKNPLQISNQMVNFDYRMKLYSYKKQLNFDNMNLIQINS